MKTKRQDIFYIMFVLCRSIAKMQHVLIFKSDFEL